MCGVIGDGSCVDSGTWEAYSIAPLSGNSALFPIMSRSFLNVNNVKKTPESFDFSLLSGAFKLFFDNKPCYQFSVHPASVFEADDVKVMSFLQDSSFFKRRHDIFSHIPLFELGKSESLLNKFV